MYDSPTPPDPGYDASQKSKGKKRRVERHTKCPYNVDKKILGDVRKCTTGVRVQEAGVALSGAGRLVQHPIRLDHHESCGHWWITRRRS
jgi:hypothetical protein